MRAPCRTRCRGDNTGCVVRAVDGHSVIDMNSLRFRIGIGYLGETVRLTVIRPDAGAREIAFALTAPPRAARDAVARVAARGNCGGGPRQPRRGTLPPW